MRKPKQQNRTYVGIVDGQEVVVTVYPSSTRGKYAIPKPRYQRSKRGALHMADERGQREFK